MPEVTEIQDQETETGQQPKKLKPVGEFEPSKKIKPVGEFESSDVKKKEPSSNGSQSQVSPSASSNVPTQTVTPDTPSESKSQDVYENIFGETVKGGSKNLSGHGVSVKDIDKQRLDARHKSESDFIKNPNVKDIADDKNSLLNKEETRIAGMLSTNAEKAALHSRITAFRNNFYNASLTPEDIDIVHGGLEGMTNQQAADYINTKSKKLKDAGDAALKKGVDNYVNELKELNNGIAIAQDRAGDLPFFKKRYEDLTNQKAFLQHAVTQIYDVRADKVAKGIADDLKSSIDETSFRGMHNTKPGDLFDGKTDSPIRYNHVGNNSYVLSEKSQEYIRKKTDEKLNKNPDEIINAVTSGDLNKKERNYPDIAKKVIDYYNTVPVVENAHKEFNNEFIKKHPEAKGYIEHQQEISSALSPDKLKAATAYINTYADKQAVNIGNKYLGENGILTGNSELRKIHDKYAAAVANKTMTEDVAKKQIEAESQNNPVLKSLYKNYQKELNTVRDNAKDMWGKYIQKSLTAIDPNIELNSDGSVGIKGKNKSDSKRIVDEYNDGLAKSTAQVFKDQHVALGADANEKAKRLGAFWGTFGESLNDMQGSFSKYWFDKTGYGGDNVRAFQARKDANIPISASDEAKKWEYKGLMSLAVPDFYLSKVGGQIPLFAGAAAVGALTEGAGLPEYASYLASAGLFDAQASLSTYNDIVTSGQRDSQGNKLTELDASNAASKQFKETILPDALFMAVNMGVLSRAKVITKPSIGRTILSAGKNAAVGAIPLSWQSYLGYANEQKAQGRETDFWDYAQDGRFTKSLIDGIIGGGILGLAHIPSEYAKQTENWKRLVYNSEGELKNNSLYGASLQHEMGGYGDKVRDALKIKLATENWKGRESEKAEVEQALQYSTALKRNIEGAGIDVSDVAGAYQAHNLALADLHDAWAEQNKDNKNLSSIYSDQAKDFRENAKKAMEGGAKYYYLQDAGDKPIFISDQGFKALDAEGKIKDLMDKKIIKNVIKSDDPEFAAKYKEANSNKVSAEPPAETQLEEKDTDKIITALKGNVDNFSGAGQMMYGTHLDNEQLHETLAKELISQGVEHPNILRENIGADAFALIEPIIEKQKNISSQLKTENNEDEKTEKTNEVDGKEGEGSNIDTGTDASPSLKYKPNIRDDYFAKADFFTPEEKEKFQTLDEAGQDKMIDDKREQLKNNTNEKENNVARSEESKSVGDNPQPLEEKIPKEKELKLGERYKKISNENDFVDPYDRAVQYFADGGKILPSEIKRLQGGKGDKAMNISLIKNDAPTVKQIAHDLWESDHFGKYEDTHYIDAVEDALRNFNSKSKMQNDLVERYDFEAASEKYAQQQYGKEAIDMVNNLSEDQINHLLELDAKEGSEKEMEDYINSLSDNKNESNEIKKSENKDASAYRDSAQRLRDEGDEEGAKKLEDAANKLEAGNEPPAKPPEPNEEGLHPRDNEWTSIQKKDLSEKVQKENAFTQTNRETVDKTIDRVSKDAVANGRTWQAQVEYEVNALHKQYFNEDGSIKEAFNPTTEQLALIGMRLMDINEQAEKSSFNPNDMNDVATNDYLASEQNKAERLLSFGEAGRAFQFRQTLMKLGVGGKIEIMRKKLSSSIEGGIPKNEEEFNKLSDREKQKVKPVYDAFNEWKKSYEKENRGINTADEKYSQEEFEKRIKAEVDKIKKQKEDPKAKLSVEQKKVFADKLRNFADKVEKFGSADLPDGTKSQGLDLQKAVADAIRYIADKIENGKIPDLIADAISKFSKEGVDEKELRDKINEGLREAGIEDKDIIAPTSREKIVSKMEAIAKNDGVNTITREMVNKGLVRDYLHDLVNRGISDPKDVLEEGAKELSKTFPDTDVKRLRDAYLKDGYFAPDKSEHLKEVAKKATETFRAITKLERDIEALKMGQDISGDKTKRNVVISDYEKSLRDEKNNLIKERNDVARDEKNEQRKADRLAEIDRKIRDLNDHGRVWDRAKRGGRGVDQELAAKNEELRKALIKNGIKPESGSAESKAAKEKVIDTHNERVDDLGKKISDMLNDDNVSDADKKVLSEVKKGLDKLNIKSDVSDLNTKINKGIAAADKLFKDNITKLVGGDKASILGDLKNISKQFGKDNKSTLQEIQLNQLKQRQITRKEQSERDLAAKNFDDAPKLADFKKDNELLALTRDRKKAERELLYQADKYKRENATFWERQVDRLKRLQRANLISGIFTNAKVLVSGIMKPVSDAAVRETVGRGTIPLLRKLGITGEREVSDLKATAKGFVDSFKGMTLKKAGELRGRAESNLDNAITNYQAANDQLISLEGTPEYDKYYNKEFAKAKNDYQTAQADWAASMMYDFISPRSWNERLRILKSGTSTFEENMGGVKGRSWADEKSVHAAGTFLNRAIYVLETFGRTHGVMKDPSARQAFTEGYIKRGTEAIENGEQLTPSKLEGIALQSYNDFLGGKFQDKNSLSEYIRKQEDQLGKGGFLSKVASALIGFTTPVLKVPLNIEWEGLGKYTAGLPIAVGKTMYEIKQALGANDLTFKDAVTDFNGTMDAIREHMKELPPAKRDQIIEYANKGAFGAVLSLVAGSMAAAGNLKFGGAYDEKHKGKREYFLNKDTGKVEALNYGEIAINGHRLGKLWSAIIMHLPPLMPAIMSATYIQKYKDERGGVNREKPEDLVTASRDAFFEVVRTGWEESALKTIGDVANAPTNLFSSFTTQMAAKNISEYFDTDASGNLIPRKGENWWQDALLRTGGRKFVPTKKEYGIDLGKERMENFRDAKDYRRDDPYYKK